MFALVFGQIYHFMGFIAGLKGFTAAVLGGIGSIPGAMIGGLIVGLAESYATGYLPQGSTFQNLYVFALLILVILIRPSGLSRQGRDHEGLMAGEGGSGGPPDLSGPADARTARGSASTSGSPTSRASARATQDCAGASCERGTGCPWLRACWSLQSRPPSSRSSRPRATSSATGSSRSSTRCSRSG